MVTCRILTETALVVRKTNRSFGHQIVKHSVAHPVQNTDFAIEGFSEFEHHYNIIVFDSIKNVVCGGYKEEILNVPKDIIRIDNKHTLFRYVEVSGTIEQSLPICPECHDTKYVKEVQGNCVKCIGNPPYRHICERCAIQWDVRYTSLKSKYSNY